MSIFVNFVQKDDFEQSQLEKVGVTLSEFYFLSCLHCGYKGKVVLKLQKFPWTNIFTIEMFIFASFVQNIDFEGSQFQRVGIALAEFRLFQLSSLQALG